MRRVAISCAILIIFHILFNFQFQFCVGRTEDDPPKNKSPQQAILDSIFEVSESNSGLDDSKGKDEAFTKCGLPNEMGLNKQGLEFLSTAHTKAGEFPWTVAILRSLKKNARQQTLLYSGAGSLIHPSVVLTAANKHHRHTTAMDIVRAGEWDFGETNEEYPYQDRTIAHIFSLDEADADAVQLVFVTEPFVLTYNVRTVCLALPGTSTASADNRDCTTAAWGQQNCSGLKGLHSILGRTDLSTETERSACEVDWQQYLEDATFKLKNNQFCTKRKTSIDDSCFCDHGAALFCAIPATNGKTRYEQIGVSIATGGCTRELPGIFSSVTEQRTRIDSIFAEKGLDTAYYSA